MDSFPGLFLWLGEPLSHIWGHMDDDFFRRLPPEHEAAIRTLASLAGVPQNRGDVEAFIAWDVRRELVSGGYAETTRFDPFDDRYPCIYQDGFDHYRLTPMGRAYFDLRRRSRLRWLGRYVLPAAIAFLGALAGAFIGTSH